MGVSEVWRRARAMMCEVLSRTPLQLIDVPIILGLLVREVLSKVQPACA